MQTGPGRSAGFPLPDGTAPQSAVHCRPLAGSRGAAAWNRSSHFGSRLPSASLLFGGAVFGLPRHGRGLAFSGPPVSFGQSGADRAPHRQPGPAAAIPAFGALTDIAFTHDRSASTQARQAAPFVALGRRRRQDAPRAFLDLPQPVADPGTRPRDARPGMPFRPQGLLAAPPAASESTAASRTL